MKQPQSAYLLLLTVIVSSIFLLRITYERDVVTSQADRFSGFERTETIKVKEGAGVSPYQAAPAPKISLRPLPDMPPSGGANRIRKQIPRRNTFDNSPSNLRRLARPTREKQPTRDQPTDGANLATDNKVVLASYDENIEPLSIQPDIQFSHTQQPDIQQPAVQNPAGYDPDAHQAFPSSTSDDLSIQNPPTQQYIDQTPELLERITNERLIGAHEIRWSLNDAIMAALFHSNRVSALKIEAVEELQNVGIEYGQFDIRQFIEQSFRESSEPVGNSIDTAVAQNVINEEDLNIRAGVRRQLRTGGDIEISQSYQFRDNDSGILVPRNQAISRFNAQLNKELLRGAGRSIAMNQVLVAWHDASAQRAESVAEIANQLTDVTNAYWDIYAARGALLASRENWTLANQVLQELRARADIDADQNLLDQTQATISQRELEIVDARNDLLQAQIQLVSLVNAPQLLYNVHAIEILPQVQPDLIPRAVDVNSRINTAIQRRPEIEDAISQIRSAQAINHLSLNELLPRLTLSLESGLNGLDENRDFGGAFGNQFDNRVTYQAGVNFEVPIGNRQARFGKRRAELAVARLQTQWQQQIEQVKAEVLISAQDFATNQTRLAVQRNVLNFSASELRFLQLRKTIIPKANSNPSFALTQLLTAQTRLGTAKADFAQAVADKQRAIFDLNRSTGILVNPNVIPLDGGPVKPGCFAVFHQLLEEKPQFNSETCRAQKDTLRKSSPVRSSTNSHANEIIIPAQPTIPVESEIPIHQPLQYPLHDVHGQTLNYN